MEIGEVDLCRTGTYCIGGNTLLVRQLAGSYHVSILTYVANPLAIMYIFAQILACDAYGVK